jgi:DNA-binding response OmpR family regulator
MPEHQPTILIAEDNPGLARVLSFKFKSSGFATVVCGDGQSAWEAFQSEDISAIVSDQEMPRMSGIELCKCVRTKNQQVPFFLVTGRQLEISSELITDELRIGGIFGKPFSPATVIAAVNGAIKDALVKQS